MQVSTIWLARALPPGAKPISLELEEKEPRSHGENLAKAGLSDVITVKTGPALDTLKALDAEGVLKDVDFWFIDAVSLPPMFVRRAKVIYQTIFSDEIAHPFLKKDKENNKNYVEFTLAGNHSHGQSYTSYQRHAQPSAPASLACS